MRLGRIRHDDVEGIVARGLCCHLSVGGDHITHARATVLAGEWQNRGGASCESGDAGLVKVVGGLKSSGGLLLNVAVAVDSAGQHEQSSGINVFGARCERRRDGCDFAGSVYGNIGANGATLGRHERAIADGGRDGLRRFRHGRQKLCVRGRHKRLR